MIIAASLAFILIAFAGVFQLAFFLQPKEKTTVNLKAYGHTVSEQTYRKAMVETELIYRYNKKAFPTKAAKLNKVQRHVVKNLVVDSSLYKQAKKDKIQIDENKVKKDAETFYQSLKKASPVRYSSLLKKYNTTDKAVHRFIINRNIQVAYGEADEKAYMKKVTKDRTAYSNKSAGTIDGDTVTRGEYTYYLIMKNLSSVSSGNGSISANAKLNREIFQEIAKNRAMIAYCEDHHFQIDDKAVKKKVNRANRALRGFFKDDKELDHYLETYGLTTDVFKQYQTEQERADVAQEAIAADATKRIAVSDKEIKAYYKKHANRYEKDYVDAAHILTKHEKTAKGIVKEAKDIHTKAGFSELMKKYQSNKDVIEVNDLGRIGPKTMVMAFSNAAFSAPLNQAAGPVATRYGYHVIFVYKRHVANQMSSAWKDHKEAIAKTLKKQKGSTKTEALIDSFKTDNVKPLSTLSTPEEMYVNTVLGKWSRKIYNKKKN